MKPLPIPRKNTAARSIFNAMTKCVETNKEVCISGLSDGLGRKISHNSFSPAIGRIKKHHFQGLHFYTRKDQELSGIIYLGFLREQADHCHRQDAEINPIDKEALEVKPGEEKPSCQQSKIIHGIKNVGADHKAEEPECANPLESAAYDDFMAALER